MRLHCATSARRSTRHHGSGRQSRTRRPTLPRKDQVTSVVRLQVEGLDIGAAAEPRDLPRPASRTGHHSNPTTGSAGDRHNAPAVDGRCDLTPTRAQPCGPAPQPVHSMPLQQGATAVRHRVARCSPRDQGGTSRSHGHGTGPRVRDHRMHSPLTAEATEPEAHTFADIPHRRGPLPQDRDLAVRTTVDLVLPTGHQLGGSPLRRSRVDRRLAPRRSRSHGSHYVRSR